MNFWGSEEPRELNFKGSKCNHETFGVLGLRTENIRMADTQRIVHKKKLLTAGIQMTRGDKTL